MFGHQQKIKLKANQTFTFSSLSPLPILSAHLGRYHRWTTFGRHPWHCTWCLNNRWHWSSQGYYLLRDQNSTSSRPKWLGCCSRFDRLSSPFPPLLTIILQRALSPNVNHSELCSTSLAIAANLNRSTNCPYRPSSSSGLAWSLIKLIQFQIPFDSPYKTCHRRTVVHY